MPLGLSLAALLLALGSGAPATQPPAASAATMEATRFRADALGVEALVNHHYAYLERLPGGRFELTARLRAEAASVSDRRFLLRFAERALLLLADDHAHTGSNLPDSWALVPSDADLWIEKRGERFVVDAVRSGSPAAAAGVRTGDELVAVDGIAAAVAVRAFWADLGVTEIDTERASFAARVLAAGRRDRTRNLSVSRQGSAARTFTLARPHGVPRPDAPVSSARVGRTTTIFIHDALGQEAMITAFVTAMSRVPPGEPVVIDLTDTPSGGNTTVARAILGWFVDSPRVYQMHDLPAEQRRTGIVRRWLEMVAPRPGKRHRGPIEVRVGRWTGSMGEGLAIGFDAIGAWVRGSRMAGLRGAIYDHVLPHSGLALKLPTERLMTVGGLPREAFAPGR